MEAGFEKEGPKERKFGLFKEKPEVGKDFEFIGKQLEELFDFRSEKSNLANLS